MHTRPRIVFSTLLLALTLMAYFVPYYDWDLVAYVGSAIAIHEKDATKIREQAYATLQRDLPEDDYLDIARGSYFRGDVANNSEHFRQQLRFYEIRPAYIHLLALLHRGGIGYVKATRFISALAIMGIGLLSFFWARLYIDESAAAVCIPLLLLTPVVFTSARTGSPDALSAFIVLLGTFELMEHKRLLIGCALLLGSLFLRTDNVIFVFLLLALWAILRTEPRLRIFTFLAALLSLLIVLGINRVEHSYSWSVLMRNTQSPIVNPAEVTPDFSTRDFLAALRDTVDEARESSVMVFPFLATLALFSGRVPQIFKHLVVIVLLSWFGHLLLFPHIEDRYFVAGSVFISIAALTTMLPQKQADG